MFAVRRIFRNRKTLSNYICTSSAVQCEKSSKSNEASDATEGKESSKSEKAAKSGEKRYESLFSKSSKPKKSRKKIASKESSGDTLKNDIFKNMKKNLVSSAEKVAEDLGGNKMQTKKDLLNYIKTFEVVKEPEKETKLEVEEIIPDSAVRVFKDLEGLKIFNPNVMQTTGEQVELKIWDALEAEDLAYNSLVSPRNYFEELIQWTNEGKLWRFPIDNDQGLEEEAKVNFTEHIFMEQYLEPWCPKKGPLRKFMELVLIGLSKNPYLTVEDKKEHIFWFKKYFEEKKKLLQELGAMGATKEIEV